MEEIRVEDISSMYIDKMIIQGYFQLSETREILT